MQTKDTTPKLGEILMGLGIATEQQITEALALAGEQGIRLGEALIRLGVLDEDRLTWALGTQLDLSYVDLQLDMIDWDFLMQFAIETMAQFELVPLSRVGESVTAVVADPKKPGLADAIRRLFPYHNITVQLSSSERIAHVLNEAARLEVERRLASNPGPRTYQTQGTMGPLELIESRAAGRILLVQSAAHPEGSVFTDGGAAEALSESDQRLSLDSFIKSLELPGGMIGFQPALDAALRPAIRAVSVATMDGQLISLSKITDDSEGPRESIRSFASDQPEALKAAIMAKPPAVEGAPPPISLESYVTCRVPAWIQIEVPDPVARIQLAKALTGAAHWPMILLEWEGAVPPCPTSLDTAPGMGPVMAISMKPVTATECTTGFKFIPGKDADAFSFDQEGTQ